MTISIDLNKCDFLSCNFTLIHTMITHNAFSFPLSVQDLWFFYPVQN